MNDLYPTHTEETLRERCAQSMHDIAEECFTAEQCEEREDFLSLFVLDAIKKADDPSDVASACEYAISELKRAAYAADDLEKELNSRS